MGEARRRKLAGDPPRGPKREPRPRMKRCDPIDEMIGDSVMVHAMAMMLGARLSGRNSLRQLK